MSTSIKAYVAGALLVGLAVAACVQTVRLSQKEAALATLDKTFSDYRSESEKNARTASENFRREEQRRNEAMRKADAEAQTNLTVARADAAASGDALARLRARVAAAARGRVAASHSPATGVSPPASAPADLPDEVLEGVGEAARQLAAYADEAAIAGHACERAYDALTQSTADQ